MNEPGAIILQLRHQWKKERLCYSKTGNHAYFSQSQYLPNSRFGRKSGTQIKPGMTLGRKVRESNQQSVHTLLDIEQRRDNILNHYQRRRRKPHTLTIPSSNIAGITITTSPTASSATTSIGPSTMQKYSPFLLLLLQLYPVNWELTLYFFIFLFLYRGFCNLFAYLSATNEPPPENSLQRLSPSIERYADEHQGHLRRNYLGQFSA